MKPKVYIETSVISYLTSRRSQDPVIAGHQAVTLRWWAENALAFDRFVSDLVEQEAEKGDSNAAAQRLEAISDFPVLETSAQAVALARELVRCGVVPRTSDADAMHIAIAATNGIDYIVTWNCKHLANAKLRSRVRLLVENAGYSCPEICTPEELMEE